jgi:hypothetical protein
MYISEIRLSFETLERAMKLPPTVRVVAVQEEDIKGVLKIRVVSTTEPPEQYELKGLDMVGEAYANPKKYRAKPNFGKGQVPTEAPKAPPEPEAPKAE